MLDRKIKKFFTVSIISVLLMCTVVFGWAIVYMQEQTETSGHQSNIYVGSKPADSAEIRSDYDA